MENCRAERQNEARMCECYIISHNIHIEAERDTAESEKEIDKERIRQTQRQSDRYYITFYSIVFYYITLYYIIFTYTHTYIERERKRQREIGTER